jgi:hypothetical protein
MNLTIVSSHRPHTQSSQFAANQVRALESWLKVAVDVIYLGVYEPGLARNRVSFVGWEQFPRIKDMAGVCRDNAIGSNWCAIVNADIVLSIKLRGAIDELRARNARCATSLRYQFDEEKDPFTTGVREDLGLDFFAANRGMWNMAANDFPKCYRIGHGVWDTAMLAFFSRWGGSSAYDLTPQRLVFHPHHGDRRSPHTIECSDEWYRNNVTWPKGRLRDTLTERHERAIPSP